MKKLAFFLMLIFSMTASNSFAQTPPEFDDTQVKEKREEVFVSVEVMPEFPSGQEALFDYIVKNIKYPKKEKKAGIQGTVYVYFVVDKQGRVTNTEVKRGVRGGAGLDEEALRVISSMPPWSPAKHNGKPVMVAYTLPVKFILDNKK
jgi:periplasmic protein TonB